MSENFAEASHVTPLDEGRFVCNIPDGWQQGRGAFGGLSIAIAVRALETQVSERPLRALTAELPGPLMVGEAHIETRVLRQGKGLTSLEATMLQQDEVKVRVTGMFGVDRVQDLEQAPPPPTFEPPFERIPPVPENHLAPTFARHFEYRVTGPLPFSSSPEARTEGWIRPRVALSTWGPAELVGMADAYWPSFFSMIDTFRPMGTIAFGLHLTKSADRLDPTQPLYHRARTLAGSGGYISELRELWTQDGQLVALNPQTFAVIK